MVLVCMVCARTSIAIAIALTHGQRYVHVPFWPYMSMNLVRSWYVHGTLGQNDWNVLHVLRGLMFAPQIFTHTNVP